MGERKRRVLFVAWFLTPQRRWLGAFLNPERYDCGYVGLPQRVDITKKRTSVQQWVKHFILAIKARWHLLWNRYDLIVSAFPQVGFEVAVVNALTFEQTPHVVWYFNCGHEYQGGRRFFSRMAFRSIRRFVVYSERERVVYAHMLDLPVERFVFTHLTGVALDRRNYAGAAKRYGLPERYIASLGSSSRDFDMLFAATEGLGVQTVVVTHAQALGGRSIPPWVTVVESVPQEDYLGILADAEVCVIPVNNVETASGQMTLIQAMWLGVPVVATRCIGTENYIAHGENGLLVEMGDVAGLRDSVVNVLEDDTLRDTLSRAGHAFAEEHFGDEAGARLLERLFDEVVEG